MAPAGNSIDDSPFAQLICDKQGVIIEANDALCALFELHHEAVVKRPLKQLLTLNQADSNDSLLDAITHALALALTDRQSLDVRLHRQSKTPWYQVFPQALSNNRYLLLFVPQRDDPNITQGYLKRFEAFLCSADIGVWHYDSATGETRFSNGVKELLLLNHHSPLSWQSLQQMVAVKDRHKFDPFLAPSPSGKHKLAFRFRIDSNDVVRVYELFAEHIYLENGHFKLLGLIKDQTESKAMLDALNEANESKKLALEAGNIGNWRAQIDEQGQWIWQWDQRANEMFCLNIEDIGVLEKWAERIHPEDFPVVMAAVEDSLANGNPFHQEYRAILPNQEIIYILAKGKVSQGQNQQNSRIDGICIDQTPIYQARLALQESYRSLESRVNQRTTELQLAKERAEIASQAKSEFLSMISHELRTPMNAVIGALELLSLADKSGEERDLIETASTSASNLIYILNDILDINKIESGKMQLEQQDFHLAGVIADLIKSFSPVASRQGLRFAVQEALELPDWVEGDIVKVRQILSNLLSNAMKFTHTTQEQTGCVSLNIMVGEQNDIVTRVRFTVTDNGIGIDKATQKRLFAPFVQAQRSTTRNYGGTGLGLAICGKLTNLMGGSINLKSELGQGAQFCVELPFWRAHHHEQTQELSEHTIGVVNLGQPQATLDWIKQCLTDKGGRVKCYQAEQLGIDTLALPLVIILATGEADELGFLANQAASPKGHSNWLVALPQHHRKTLTQTIPQIDSLDSYLLSKALLLKAVHKRLDSGLAIDLDEMELDLCDPLTQEPTPKIKGDADILVVEDNPLNQKLILKQLDMLGYRCNLAEDGLVGVHLWQSANYKLILTDCHMPNLDGYDMSKQIRQIENSTQRKSVPIVAITGAAMATELDDCYRSGMNDFVSKPVQLRDLKKVIQKWYRHEE
ncbi:ATP-binding protein [Shewanella halotolerans]|uniref:ATP-binding protein n=1 Tax=Shewanella halotolerans TaxID=2864204 RepID=UPI001C6571F0|nr:ATP-binding protein [Shewanella halotolerans]QYJ89172.1 response regulator [Shewanella halotolerans]